MIVLKVKSLNYLSWYNKGIAYYNLDSLEQAKACFQKTILLNPYHSHPHYFLGIVCIQQGKLVEAMLSLSTSLLVYPENRFKSNAVNALSGISKVTDEINGYVNKAVQTTDNNFEYNRK